MYLQASRSYLRSLYSRDSLPVLILIVGATVFSGVEMVRIIVAGSRLAQIIVYCAFLYLLASDFYVILALEHSFLEFKQYMLKHNFIKCFQVIIINTILMLILLIKDQNEFTALMISCYCLFYVGSCIYLALINNHYNFCASTKPDQLDYHNISDLSGSGLRLGSSDEKGNLSPNKLQQIQLNQFNASDSPLSLNGKKSKGNQSPGQPSAEDKGYN